MLEDIEDEILTSLKDLKKLYMIRELKAKGNNQVNASLFNANNSN